MIQIDIEMPKSCSECFAFHYGTTYDQLPSRCEATKMNDDFYGKAISGIDRFCEKPEWCPLKEVK